MNVYAQTPSRVEVTVPMPHVCEPQFEIVSVITWLISTGVMKQEGQLNELQFAPDTSWLSLGPVPIWKQPLPETVPTEKSPSCRGGALLACGTS